MESTYIYQQQKDVRSFSIKEADLADEFACGRSKLIPVIFSHGLGGQWRSYQMVGQELASNGYLVLMMDHVLDGSCNYTEQPGEGAEPLRFSTSDPSPFVVYGVQPPSGDEELSE